MVLVPAIEGLATGLFFWAARRVPVFAWIAFAPLTAAALAGPPSEAAIAGAVAGALAAASGVGRPEFRSLVPLAVVPTTLAFAVATGSAAFGIARLGAWFAPLALAAVAVGGFVPLRLMGAPRWVSNPLACTQEGSLTMVHTARMGSDFATTALLALAAGAMALAAATMMGAVDVRSGAAGVAVATGLVAGGLLFGARSLRRARERPPTATVRMAMVVCDGPPPATGKLDGLWPTRSEAYRDVEGTVARYDPLVRRAAQDGAEIVVLPEICVLVDAATRDRWTEAVRAWARAHDLVVVAPAFDQDVPVNALAVVEPSSRGEDRTYDKQHPARGMEPSPRRRCTPSGSVTVRRRRIPLHAVICVDLDYADLVAPVRSAGGVLVAPSNDWFEGFDVLHHRTAVWSAVLTGVPTLRATGHGISSVHDGAGRVLAQATSADGPVVLVVDVPLAPPSAP